MYAETRYLYQNELDGTTLTTNSQAGGIVSGAIKVGLGSATLLTSGTYLGNATVLFTVQVDDVSSGNEIGLATFRWKTSSDVSWVASGVTTAAAWVELQDGVEIEFVAGAGNDFEGGETFSFWAYGTFGLANLTKFDRETMFRSDRALTPEGDWEMNADRPSSDTAIYALRVFNGKLYGGSENALYEWNGATWMLAATGGCYGGLAELGGKLYALSGSGDLLEWDGVSSFTVKASSSPTPLVVNALTAYNGKLYASSVVSNSGGLYEWDGVSAWVSKATAVAGEYNIADMLSFSGSLYAAGSILTKLLKWDGVSAWQEKADPGTGGLYALCEHNSKLYAASGTGKLYEYDGATTLTEKADAYENAIIYALVSWDGDLYAANANGNLLQWNGVDAWTLSAATYQSQEIRSLTTHQKWGSTRIFAGTYSSAMLYSLSSGNRIEIDFGAAMQITAVIFFDHNLSDAAIITLSAGADPDTTPSYTQTLTVADPLVFYPDETYRYWRITIDDNANPDGYLEIGELYMGTYLELTQAIAPDWGMQEITRYIMQSQAAASGVLRQTTYGKQRVWQTSYSVIQNSEMTQLQAMFDAAHDVTTGIVKPVFVHLFSDESSYLALCTLSAENARTYASVDVNAFNITLTEVPRV